MVFSTFFIHTEQHTKNYRLNSDLLVGNNFVSTKNEKQLNARL